MAGASIRGKASTNPFYEDDDDVDDDEFLNHPKSGSAGYMLPNYLTNEQRSHEEKKQQLLEKKREIEERTLQSTYRSIGILHESEQIGIATAEELTKQREQLENTERRLDDINNSLRTSERHIQNIKSVFSSFKNYFSGRNNHAPSTTAPIKRDEAKPPSELERVLDQTRGAGERRSNDDHPALRARGLTPNNPFDEDPYGPSFSRKVDEQLDRNLDDIGNSLCRLKGLGLGLQKELDDQDGLIDRIQNKTEDTDWKVTRQTRDMNKILK